jgi:nucleoside 2-deoxyribosyltransferase
MNEHVDPTRASTSDERQRRAGITSLRRATPRAATPRAVYLAGPSGFFEAGRQWHRQVVLPAVRAAGLIPRDPWSGPSPLTEILATMEYGPDRRSALRAANLDQGRYDLELIEDSEAVLASLDGQDVDSGTAVEIGYGFARGLLIVGVRTDSRRCSDNEGSTVNLMIETCIADSGGILTDSLQEAVRFIAGRLAANSP